MEGQPDNTEAGNAGCRFLRQATTLGLPGTEVHFWTFDLALPVGARLGPIESALSPEERERGARFAPPDARRRFVVARMALREVLSSYLGLRPEDVALGAGNLGKPLMAEQADAWLHFNLSHSGETAVIACARDRDVGVDIESLRQDLDHDAVVERYFSAAEKLEWATLPDSERAQAFLRGWTCKEAYVKALGEGLSHPSDAYSVRLSPSEPAALLGDRLRPGAELAWSLHLPPAPAGLVAAIAIAGNGARVVIQPSASLRSPDVPSY
jgi:4'-phosphopantetheinyl transferase